MVALTNVSKIVWMVAINVQLARVEKRTWTVTWFVPSAPTCITTELVAEIITLSRTMETL